MKKRAVMKKREKHEAVQAAIHKEAEQRIGAFLDEVAPLAKKHQVRVVYAVRSAGCQNLACFSTGVLTPEQGDKGAAEATLKGGVVALVADSLSAELKER